MKNTNVYLFFNGNCEEALQFYQDALGGHCPQISRFSDGSLDVPEHHKNKIMHAEFVSKGINFMASDGQPDQPVIIGNNIQLALDFDHVDEESQVFDKLSQGAEILMPLQDTFWGAHFGMLKDKFGIYWLLNCDPTNSDK